MDLPSANPQAELTIDLDEQVVVLPDGRALGFPIDDFSKTCLLKGVDQLGVPARSRQRYRALRKIFGLIFSNGCPEQP